MKDIMSGIWQFYYELYTSSPTTHLSECIQVIPRLVSNDMNVSLMARVTASEVERVVFSLGSLKALGLDGFNGLFYQ